MENYVEKAREVVNQVNRVILGKEREVEEVMLAFLAGGHILLEDIPEAQVDRFMMTRSLNSSSTADTAMDLPDL